MVMVAVLDLDIDPGLGSMVRSFIPEPYSFWSLEIDPS
jgi:hypothetical protein